jgi:ADP-ribose pyrophosphatase YjhB (NUDIX family)
MIDQLSIDHHIQKHIIGVLIHQKHARFRDLRPPETDTNLFSYHLKLLQKAGLVEKSQTGYTLSPQGLAYIDRVSVKKLSIRTQPKIITMVALFNSRGQVALQRRVKQPYIDTWTLPYGKLHIDDESVMRAAEREVQEKLSLVENLSLTHTGDCYIHVQLNGGDVLSSTLAHVFTGKYDGQFDPANIRWVATGMLDKLPLAPAVTRIIAAVQLSERFFMEITEEWQKV